MAFPTPDVYPVLLVQIPYAPFQGERITIMPALHAHGRLTST